MAQLGLMRSAPGTPPLACRVVLAAVIFCDWQSVALAAAAVRPGLVRCPHGTPSPLPLFPAVQAVVLFSYWQSVALAIMAKPGHWRPS